MSIAKVVFAGTNFVLVGQNASAQPRSAYSSDAISWASTTPPGASIYTSVAANSTRVVIVGNGGSIATSDNNGLTWTARTSGTSLQINDVVWDATSSQFVAVGASGLVLTSSTGISWTPRTSGTGNALIAVCGSPNGIMAVGANGTAVLSINGVAWSTSPSGTTEAFSAVAPDPGSTPVFVAVGSSGVIFSITRTASSQFQVPDDKPTTGWIKAEA